MGSFCIQYKDGEKQKVCNQHDLDSSEVLNTRFIMKRNFQCDEILIYVI